MTFRSSSSTVKVKKIDGTSLMMNFPRIALFLLWTNLLFSQPNGNLDQTFGDQGVALLPSGFADNWGQLTTELPDGKILVVERLFRGYRFVLSLRKFNVNGSADSSFGDNGQVVDDRFFFDATPFEVQVGNDGKIWIAGEFQFSGFVARYNSNGSIDNQFNEGELLFLFRSELYMPTIDYVSFLDDGKFLMLGSGRENVGIAVKRFTAEGLPDPDIEATMGLEPGLVLPTFSIDTLFQGIKVATHLDDRIIVLGNYERETETGLVLIDLTADGATRQLVFVSSLGTCTAPEATDFAIQEDGRLVIGGNCSTGLFNIPAFVTRRESVSVIDTTFGEVGLVLHTTEFFSTLTDVEVLQGDTLLVTGIDVGFLSSNVLFSRLLPDGSVDPALTSAQNGFVDKTWGSAQDLPSHILQLSDGGLVVTGATAGTTTIDLALAHYGPNGEDVVSFGDQGIVVIDDGRYASFSSDLVLQTDGKVVVGGQINFGTNQDFVLARFSRDGDLDATFGTNGIVHTDFDFGEDMLVRLHLLEDGKLLAGGSVGNGFDLDVGLVTYATDGTPTPDFGAAGFVQDDLLNANENVRDLIVTSDGSAIVGIESDEGLLLVKYLPDGSRDDSFGEEGLVAVQAAASPQLSTIVEDDAGRLLLLFSQLAISSAERDMTVARLQPDGSFDLTFGQAGLLTIPEDGNETAADLALLPNGDFLIMGFSNSEGETTRKIVLLKFSATGMPATDFGTNGRATLALNNFIGRAALTVVGENLLVTARDRTLDMVIAQFDPSGALDTEFGNQGIANFDFFGEDFTEVPAELLVDDEAGLLLAGTYNTSGAQDIFVSRHIYDLMTVRTYQPPTTITDLRIYPNPTTTTCNLAFYLKQNASVSISLCDPVGRPVTQSASSYLPAGEHLQTLQLPEHLSAGHYHVIVNVEGKQLSSSMLIIQ